MQPRTSTLRAELKVRYRWIPADYLEFVASLKTLDVVCGEEPEFETTPIASSLVEFLTLVAEQDPRIAR